MEPQNDLSISEIIEKLKDDEIFIKLLKFQNINQKVYFESNNIQLVIDNWNYRQTIEQYLQIRNNTKGDLIEFIIDHILNRKNNFQLLTWNLNAINIILKIYYEIQKICFENVSIIEMRLKNYLILLLKLKRDFKINFKLEELKVTIKNNKILLNIWKENNLNNFLNVEVKSNIPVHSINSGVILIRSNTRLVQWINFTKIIDLLNDSYENKKIKQTDKEKIIYSLSFYEVIKIFESLTNKAFYEFLQKNMGTDKLKCLLKDKNYDNKEFNAIRESYFRHIGNIRNLRNKIAHNELIFNIKHPLSKTLYSLTWIASWNKNVGIVITSNILKSISENMSNIPDVTIYNFFIKQILFKNKDSECL